MRLAQMPPESEADCLVEAAGIEIDHQLRLGDNIELKMPAFTWTGFVVRIDRNRACPDVLTHWTIRPDGDPQGAYGLFSTAQLKWNKDRKLWEVDPASVPQ
jgi:hypothetical protein